MEKPDSDWDSRLWIAHRTRWSEAATAKHSQCSIRNERYKIVMPEAGVIELYDLEKDVREQNNIASKNPEIVSELKTSYDAWWEDIQPYFVNDHLADVPEVTDVAAQLPMLLLGTYYEIWSPENKPVRDRTKEEFLNHVAPPIVMT